MTTHVSMEQLVEQLEAYAESGFEPASVQAYLTETLIEQSSLDRYLYFRDDRYTRHLVAKNPAFELLVICWNQGQQAPVHGHEGENCWARVERGKLRFSSYRVEREDPLQLVETETLDAQTGYLDGPAEIHAVENPAEFGEAAASLHVYSKPFDACDIYDLENASVRRVKLTYDTLFGEKVSS